MFMIQNDSYSVLGLFDELFNYTESRKDDVKHINAKKMLIPCLYENAGIFVYIKISCSKSEWVWVAMNYNGISKRYQEYYWHHWISKNPRGMREIIQLSHLSMESSYWMFLKLNLVLFLYPEIMQWYESSILKYQNLLFVARMDLTCTNSFRLWCILAVQLVDITTPTSNHLKTISGTVSMTR